MDSTTKIKRIKIVNVPLDVVAENELEEIVKAMLADGDRHQIVLLTLKDLLRARHNAEMKRTVKEASLIIPVSKGIVRGAKFLKRELPTRYMPFEFVIRLLGIIEKYKRSIYLLGSRAPDLQVSAGNLRASFPDLSIVGRCAGYYAKAMEKNIILAIRKASPSLILAGYGLPAKDTWVANNKRNFNPGIYLWCGDCFDIFSGKKSKPSRSAWESGWESFPELLRRPWRAARGFVYLYYGVLLVIHRLRRL